MSDEPDKRSFAGLSREADGRFDDDSLVKILTESIEDVAGSFGANKVPNSLKSIEVLGIMQSRYWNVATLNEFRAFMGLSKHKTFEDINPDPVVARKLKEFYDSPDAVELYPGLVTEKPKPPMNPGSGLCVNYTISHAILSDAVALIRGDRFYTVDYTPKNITNWGYNEANSDMSVNHGHVFHKLIFRAFSNHFSDNSIYAHYPLVAPSENKKICDSLGWSTRYSWEKPTRKSDLIVVHSHKAAAAVLNNNKNKNLPTETSNWADELRSFCDFKTRQLLQKNSTPLVQNGDVIHEVDIVRDVFSLAVTHVISVMFGLTLKTPSNPHGIYSEQEMFNLLLSQHIATFSQRDVANSFKLREAAKDTSGQLAALIIAKEKGGKLLELAGKLGKIIHSNGTHANAITPEPSLPSFGTDLVGHIIADHASGEDAGAFIVQLASAGIASQQLLSQCLDYYLGDGQEHLPELYRLANLNTKEADEVLMK